MGEKTKLFLLYGLMATVLLIIFIAQKRESVLRDEADIYRDQVESLLNQNSIIRLETEKLKMQRDSLDTLLTQINPESGTIIKTKIITKYENQFNYIDSLNASDGFRFFAKWISENDCE